MLALLSPRPGATKANFDRIEIGMTEAELQQLLGRKSETSIAAEKIMTQLTRHEHTCGRYFVWNGTNGTAVIRIDLGGRVVTPSWHDRDPSFFQRLRSWLPF